MTQHKENVLQQNVLQQPASPAAFCCIFLLYKKKIKKAKNKKKLKKISKFSILKEEQKKEPKRSQKGAEPMGALKYIMKKNRRSR